MSVLKICPSSGETHIAFPSDETASKELETIIGPLHCIGSSFFSSFLYCSSWVTHRIFPDLFDIQTNSELDVSTKSQSPEVSEHTEELTTQNSNEDAPDTIHPSSADEVKPTRRTTRRRKTTATLNKLLNKESETPHSSQSILQSEESKEGTQVEEQADQPQAKATPKKRVSRRRKESIVESTAEEPKEDPKGVDEPKKRTRRSPRKKREEAGKEEPVSPMSQVEEEVVETEEPPKEGGLMSRRM